MNKYTDESLVHSRRVQVRLTAEDLLVIKTYMQQTRAPTLSAAIRSAALAEAKCHQNVTKMSPEFKENKESNKESKENSLTLEKNARTHDLEFYVSWITDDVKLKALALEFLKGRQAAGEDLEERGAAKLREHFGRWLPKYQAKMEIAARLNTLAREQNFIKQAREARAAEQQRQITEQINAAKSPEAQAAAAKVLAKFAKPWHRVADRSPSKDSVDR